MERNIYVWEEFSMSDLVQRAEAEFLFSGMRLSFWHLNVSSFNRTIEVLEEDSITKWTLFAVSSIGDVEEDSRLMLRYHYDFDDEIVDRFYAVESREDAMRLVRGLDRTREHVLVSPGLFISIV